LSISASIKRDIKTLTRPSLMAGLSLPRMSFCEAEVNCGRPAIGRYSWLRSGSLRMISSACYKIWSARWRAVVLTQSRGPSSPLVAPMASLNYLCMGRYRDRLSCRSCLHGRLPVGGRDCISVSSVHNFIGHAYHQTEERIFGGLRHHRVGENTWLGGRHL